MCAQCVLNVWNTANAGQSRHLSVQVHVALYRLCKQCSAVHSSSKAALLSALDGENHFWTRETCLANSVFDHAQPYLLQVEAAFLEAWEAVSGQVYGPSVDAEELELANVTPEDAWQQIQDSIGLAAGLEQHVLDATQLAHTKGD